MTSMMKREGRAKHGLPVPLSSSRSVPSSCTRWQRTCRGNTKTTGSVTALNRIFYSIARITSITHLTTSYDQLKSQGRNSHTSIILSRVPTILVISFFFSFTSFNPLQARLFLSYWIFMEVTLNSLSKNWVFFLCLETRHWFKFRMENRESKKNLEAVEWRKKCNCQFVTIDRSVVAKRNQRIAKIRYANDSCWEYAYI